MRKIIAGTKRFVQDDRFGTRMAGLAFGVFGMLVVGLLPSVIYSGQGLGDPDRTPPQIYNF